MKGSTHKAEPSRKSSPQKRPSCKHFGASLERKQVEIKEAEKDLAGLCV